VAWVGIDRTASEGFAAGAGAYGRARPAYPREAVGLLTRGLPGGARVLDLGAGTGKFTAMILEPRREVVALEPVAQMRAQLARELPAVRVAAGAAEAIPFADGTFDAVFAAQAFHWFDGPRTLAGIHRVLRPGGTLGLIWNMRDRSTRWVDSVAKIVDAYGDAIRRHETEAWRDSFAAPNGFTPLETQAFPNVQEVDAGRVLDRVSSTSFIATLPDEERASVLERVKEVLERDPDTKGRERFGFPHVTRVYFCMRS
jgi:SAM-dependent methyltransferase